jgi:hypothetical protein
MAAAQPQQKITFKQMTPRQKWIFVMKLSACILSFGMIFPNLMGD